MIRTFQVLMALAIAAEISFADGLPRQKSAAPPRPQLCASCPTKRHLPSRPRARVQPPADPSVAPAQHRRIPVVPDSLPALQVRSIPLPRPRPSSNAGEKKAAPDFLSLISVPGAWSLTRGKGVTVAIMDGGFWEERAETKTAYLPQRFRFNNVYHSPEPICSARGSTVAATIAGEHGRMLPGVAPEAKILRLVTGCPKWVGLTNVSDAQREKLNGEFLTEIIKQAPAAIRWAVDEGAKVIAFMLMVPVSELPPGLSADLQAVHSAIIHARNRGVTVVGPIGNHLEQWDQSTRAWRGSGDQQAPQLPAAWPEVLTAGCVCGPENKQCERVYSGAEAGLPNVERVRASHAFGRQLDFVVACDRVPYVKSADAAIVPLELGGTANAAALLAGVAALLHSEMPPPSAPAVERALKRTAVDVFARGFDVQSGWGRVNAEAALAAVKSGRSRGRAWR